MSAQLKRLLPYFAGAALLAFGGSAAAGCEKSCAPKPPPPPKPPCCAPKPPAPPKFPDVNVHVNVQANATATANASGKSEGDTVFFGGGGSNIIATPGFPVIQALNVGHQARKAITETRTVSKKVFVQAVCISDKGAAHGASQIFPEREVREGYAGELYRCVVGSKLHVTFAENDRFEKGETLSCSKGEALWHGGGKLECRAQTAQRNCFERSLLRRFGTGIKFVSITKHETFTRYEEESYASQGSLALDGGVGGFVH